MKNSIKSCLVVMAFASTPAIAAPTLFTSKAAFLAALQSSSTETFNSLSGGSYGSPGLLSIGGLTIQTTGPLFTQALNYYNSGTFVSAQQTSPTNVSFSFGAVNAFGFDYSDAVPGTIRVNGVSFSFVSSGFPVLSFIGVVDTATFSNASISVQGNGIDIDNVVTGTLATAVPEAPTWIMLLTGFAMMGAGLRYRRRHIVAVSSRSVSFT